MDLEEGEVEEEDSSLIKKPQSAPKITPLYKIHIFNENTLICLSTVSTL